MVWVPNEVFCCGAGERFWRDSLAWCLKSDGGRCVCCTEDFGGKVGEIGCVGEESLSKGDESMRKIFDDEDPKG